MPIPDYQTLMLPVLRVAGTNPERSMHGREIEQAIAAEYQLSEAELAEMLPSGSQTLFSNRVGWARTYLKIAGLLESPSRGHFRITALGKETLASNPERIDRQFLFRFPKFVAHQNQKARRLADSANANQQASGGIAEPQVGETTTPRENLDSGYQQLREQLASDLIEQVKRCTPAFFERLVVELLLKMGYGGSRADAGRALGRSGDGGIDGIIKEDRLGLDTIYIQAKRWTDRPVGRPDVQQFQGALSGQGAVKGIFISTSYFTDEASAYAAGLRNSKIILIDGEQLAELMIDYGIGVATAVTYEVKRIDSDYFAEGEE